jgi:hypothetical protein
MSKFFTVYQRKRRKARFGRKPFGWIESTFHLSTNINLSTEGTKRKKISDEQGRERFFDLKTVVLISFFPMFFYANWGCNGRRKIEH